MRLDRARIDRRLGREAPPAPLSVEGSVAVFHDPWGELAQRFDLGELNLPGNMAVIFAAAFRGHYAPLSRDTRVNCWQALKVFSRFLAQEGGVVGVEDLTTELFGRYVLWLDAQQSRRRKPCSIGVRYNRFQHIKRLTEWAARRHPELMPERPTFPYNPFPGRHAVKSDARQLSPSQLKAILRACYAEIDAAWATFEEGRRLFARGEDDEAHP
ncbi:MAG: phage integrase SAM-like domain-containing protein, partial [Bradyrhizobium sp.]|nr:phage integrase SAM-like domain-containing protein [Bradyrhizobium sp.]